MPYTKKTKIVATLGPTSSSEEVLEKLITAGVNVARLNFSHGTHEDHKVVLERVRSVADRLGKTVAILQDLSGPKIRTGELAEGQIELVPGAKMTLTTEDCPGDVSRMQVSYAQLPYEVQVGASILLDDGRRELKVLAIEGVEVMCEVVIGGVIKPRRGINLPGTTLKISSLTVKDRTDLTFGVDNNVDFMALSFVRSADDVKELRAILKEAGSTAAIVSKVETQEAIDNIDAIIDASDAIMVARGDLAIEVPREDVPILQKMILKKCGQKGKGSIIATQMLESMIEASVPTRAEVSDVANSILDGADAVMLSQETAMGSYPVEAVEMMARVAMNVEEKYPYYSVGLERSDVCETGTQDVVDAVTRSALTLADAVGAKAIIALTESGLTARMISRFNPKQPIIVLSPHKHVYNQMALYFGCYPVMIEQFQYIGEVYHLVSETLKEQGLAKPGDKAVILAGVPFGHSGGTNLVTTHIVE